VVTPTARVADTWPKDTIIDLDRPPATNEAGIVFATRAWERYFNSRYQTYNRHAHFFIQFGSKSSDPNASPPGPDAASRQAAAAQGYAAVRPFAVISYANFNGNGDVYIRYLASKGVLDFGSLSGREATSFRQFPRLLWGYPPTIDDTAAKYASFVCSKVLHHPVSSAGSTFPSGAPRKLGMIYTTDPGYPNLTTEYQMARKAIEACGGVVVDTATFPVNGFPVDTSTTPVYATDAMARFSSERITTILWPAGTEAKFSAAATRARYFPEWLLGPDGTQETTSVGQLQDQQQWAHAWVVPDATRHRDLQSELCYQAYREVDTTSADSDVQFFACPEYNDLRQLFTGIQVAGPKLGPYSVDKGFHAIPAVASTDPRVPACFYRSDDFTCVKDAVIEWWDTAGQSPLSSQPGCWRMVLGGRRFLPGGFPSGNLDAQRQAGSDPCNSFDNSYNVNTNPPTQ
jgi:hypothetical protein